MSIRDLIIFGEIALTAIAVVMATHFSQSKRIQDRESRIVRLEHDTQDTVDAITQLEGKMDAGLGCLHKLEKRLLRIEVLLDKNGFRERN